MDCHEAVMEFHRLYGVPIGWQPNALSFERLGLRLKLIHEEWRELLDACDSEVDHHGRLIVRNMKQDIVEMADALGDIVYVCFGMAIEMGVDLNRVIAEIQRANLSKLGEDGRPVVNRPQCGNETCDGPDCFVDPTQPKGKVLKGPNYAPPDIKEVLDSQEPIGGEFIGTNW